MFAFAGLSESWKDKVSGNVLETFTVITTDPNEVTEKIHTRMPVILKPKDYQRWLEPGDPQRLPVDLLKPYLAEEMKAWRVSQAVGNVRNNYSELCVESMTDEPPKSEEKPAEQTGFEFQE